MHLRKGVLVFAALIAICFIQIASATQLGVNYYHESMMSDQWKQPYIPTSLTQAGIDFDNIKTIAGHIKFYMNPFVQGNLEWVSSLINLANQKGLHSALSIIVDDRQLTDANWGDYSSRVVSVCQALNGKIDEIQVGSEITLHSSYSQYQVKDKVLPLIAQCKQVFSGTVSYQAFWYEKDAWKGYSGPIAFMQYENLASFTTNLNEMNSLFGSSASIGEWGVSLTDGSTVHDDWWQRDQFQQRWNLIQKTSTPIAYIFTYQEPSWNGFGIVRPDGIRRPLWDLFNQTTSSSPAPVVNSPPLNSLAASCTYNGNTACSKTSDVVSGDCRTVIFSTSSGTITLLACTKSTGIELYRNSFPVNLKFSVCLGSTCINELTGFAVVSNSLSAPSPVSTGFSLASLSISCNVNGQACSTKSDVTSGSCRTVLSGSNNGDIKVQGCDKGNGWIELYLQQAPTGNYNFCLANGCITTSSGFVKFQPTSNTVVTPPKTNSIDVSSLSVSVTPSGSKVGDYIEGTGCRKVQFSSSAGWLEARICPKSDHYEIYFLSGTAYASICSGSSCVNAGSGFASFN